MDEIGGPYRGILRGLSRPNGSYRRGDLRSKSLVDRQTLPTRRSNYSVENDDGGIAILSLQQRVVLFGGLIGFSLLLIIDILFS